MLCVMRLIEYVFVRLFVLCVCFDCVCVRSLFSVVVLVACFIYAGSLLV